MTGGDIPKFSSKESSSVGGGVLFLARAVPMAADGLNVAILMEELGTALRGLAIEGSLRSTTPFHSDGLVSGGRYGLVVFSKGVFGLNFSGEVVRLVLAVAVDVLALRRKTLWSMGWVDGWWGNPNTGITAGE